MYGRGVVTLGKTSEAPEALEPEAVESDAGVE